VIWKQQSVSHCMWHSKIANVATGNISQTRLLEVAVSSREAQIPSRAQKFYRVLWNRKIHYRVDIHSTHTHMYPILSGYTSILSIHTCLDLSLACFWTKVYVFLTLTCVLHVLSISFIGSHLPGKLVTGGHLLRLKRHKSVWGHSPASVKNTRIFSSSHQIRLRRGVCTQRQFYWLLLRPPLAPVHLTKVVKT